MVSMIGRFQRDLIFLRQGLIPKEVSGTEVHSLEYEGEEYEKLKDSDIGDLAEALLQNNVFQGPLDLEDNELSDLAALHLARVFEKTEGHNITKLNLKGNRFTTKAGEYIGAALANNPNYKIFKLSFEKINLETIGLVRVIEAVTQNKNILKLNLGIVTDHGLCMLADLLKENDSLEELIIEETKDHQKVWSQKGREALCELMKHHTQIRKVKLKTKNETKEHELFEKEIEFYAKQKAKMNKIHKEYEEIMRSCGHTQMFDNMIKLIEEKDDVHKMPVRKFFNNTFGTLLNDAIFELKKEQKKRPNDTEFFTVEGQVKYVAFKLLDGLPEGEMRHDPDNDLSDSDN